MIPIDLRGSLLIPINSRWSLLIPIDPYWFPLIPIDPHWSLWIPIDPYWCLLIPIDPLANLDATSACLISVNFPRNLKIECNFFAWYPLQPWSDDRTPRSPAYSALPSYFVRVDRLLVTGEKTENEDIYISEKINCEKNLYRCERVWETGNPITLAQIHI